MNTEPKGPGWICSILVGLSFLMSGLFLFRDPVRGVTDEALFWSTLAREPLWSQLRFLSYGLGALAAFGAIPAVSELARGRGGGWLRWTTNLAYLSFAVTAVDNFRLLPILPRLANTYVAGDAASQAWLLGIRYALLVDPATWLKFGALGTWILAVSILAGRAGSFPRGLSVLGGVVAALLFATVAAMTFEIRPLIMFAAGVGGILLLPAWFIWTGLVVRTGGSVSAVNPHKDMNMSQQGNVSLSSVQPVSGAMRAVRITHRVAASLITVMALLHVSATSRIPASSQLERIYFAGTGLAILYIALLNFIVTGGPASGRKSRLSLHLANLIYVGYVCVLASTNPTVPAISAAVVAGLATVTAPFVVSGAGRPA